MVTTTRPRTARRFTEPERIDPFTVEEQATIEVAKVFFWFFLEHVFILSLEDETYTDENGEEQPVTFGRIHREWALMMQTNPRLVLLAPRLHLKSTLLKAFAIWKMFRVNPNQVLEILYFVYKAQLANEHVENTLGFIRRNPYCRFWRNLKPYSITQVSYLVDWGDGVIGEVKMQGEGILSGTRGRHSRVVICDDILSDYANSLTQVELDRITRIFRQAILSIPPDPTDPILLVGTPQSPTDILHQMAYAEGWVWLKYPAIRDGQPLWPDKFGIRALELKKGEVGPLEFEVEYMLTPVGVVDQFFTRDSIRAITDDTLRPWDLSEMFEKGELATYGGFDVGKLVHPSHVTIFLELPDGTLVQLFQEFLDHLKYNLQVKRLNALAKIFKLNRGYFDATYNVLDDRGLSPVWRGKGFTRQLKGNMATLFAKRVYAVDDDPSIVLLRNERQLNQVTIVDKTLRAATTVEGHGDAFWSIGLALQATEDGPGIIDIGHSTVRTDQGISPSQSWLQQLGVKVD